MRYDNIVRNCTLLFLGFGTSISGAGRWIFISSQTIKYLTGCAAIFFLLAAFALAAFWADPHITFSAKSGYYESELSLTIHGSAGAQVYYTLDGSMPTPAAIPYEKGSSILLSDATSNENKYAMRTDTSSAFYADFEEDTPTTPIYQVPGYPVDKCNVVRAASFDGDGNCLDSITGIYFIGFSKKSGYEGLYTASLTVDPENLFGQDRGIYVLGSSFRKSEETPWWMWDANYQEDGPASERPAILTLFDSEQNLLLSEGCGIRINGEYSRSFLPKNIGCYARTEYSGRNEFSADLFEKDMFPHKISLLGGGNDNIFKLKDYIGQTLEQEMHFATMDLIPCALFLNGEYWGVYWLAESYNADYINDHFDVSQTNIIMVKNNELKEGREEDWLLYEEMKSFIISNDMTDPNCWWRACSLIDMDSYIDYYAAQIYLARCTDWPGHNYALWRTRSHDRSGYGDCRWRWMLFDLNSDCMTEDLTEIDTLGDILSQDAMFASLFENEEFRLRFAARLLYVGREIYIPENLEPLLADCVSLMREPLGKSNMRFYMDTKDAEFDRYLQDKLDFFNKRYAVVWDSLCRHAGTEWLADHGIEK